jgi:glycosyltransferase involved in cell wall biosynthesis
MEPVCPSSVPPRVSVLMLTYNRPQLIGRAIESVCNQSFQNWELIIVQDGSNPETAELLKCWLAKEPRIRHLPRGTVGCIAEASNYGLERARGEYIAILDDDDCWHDPHKLAIQVEFLDRNPEYVACGAGYIIVDQHGNERSRLLKPEEDEQIRASALLANPMVNCTAMFRRVVDGKPCLYDAGMTGFADWDFWLMLGTRGKLYNFPSYMAQYSLWEGSGSFHALRRNAFSAIRIVRRYRRQYRGFIAAFVLSCLYYGYAWMPIGVRRMSYRRLSALKKSLASSRGATA